MVGAGSLASGSAVHAVVVDRITGDKATLATVAAAVLGVTPYDVRASLNAPGGGPAVIAAFADADVAAATRAGLSRVGFDARVVAVEVRSPYTAVREFELGEHALVVTDRQGHSREVGYHTVELLVRATAITTTETTTTARERKFDLGRAVLSGGLINTKVRESVSTSRATATRDLLFVFAGPDATLRMADDDLLYQGLGAALQPSRMANFTYLVAQLRKRCPSAGFDERLRHRAAQTQLLGRILPPDTYLEFGIGLLADSLRRR